MPKECQYKEIKGTYRQSGRKVTQLQNYTTEHVTLFPSTMAINPLNAELNPICHLLALLGAHHILHVSGIRVKIRQD